VLTVNDRDQLPWRPGLTVQDVLDAMDYDYALITITVNDELVPEADYETRIVPDGARVTVFHLAHGG